MSWFWSLVKLWREAMIGGLIISNMFLWIALDKKDDKVRDLTYNLQDSMSYSEELEASIVIRNEMISQLARDKDKFKELSDETQKEIAKKKIIHQRKIQAILNAQIGDTCPDSIEWLVDITEGDLKWRK